ncbi:MAG: uL15 family ribosomal protein [Candidatus Dojkabacteria bacterium]|nr:uL15 family ribosomal protein [Candidatus Dojkabacteria bacterium]
MKIDIRSPKTKSKKKIIGRGYGSGKGGHTVGRGVKGQRSRSGFRRQKAWVRESKLNSLPKLRGIGKRSNKERYRKSKESPFVLNVSDLENIREGETINIQYLKRIGLVKGSTKKVLVRILGKGKINKKFTIRKIGVSEAARKKIEQAGGKVY